MSTVDELRAALAQASGGQRVQLLKTLARALEQEGALAEAARSLVEAHRLAPTDLEVVRAGFRLFSAGKQWPGALKWLTVELGLTQGDAARAQLLLRTGKLYQDELHDFERAQQAYAEARQLDPDVFSERAPPPEVSAPSELLELVEPTPAVPSEPDPAALEALGLGQPPPPEAPRSAKSGAPERRPEPALPSPPRQPAPRSSNPLTAKMLRPFLFAAVPAGLVLLALVFRGLATELPNDEQCPAGATLKKVALGADVVKLSCVAGETPEGVTVTLDGKVVLSRVVFVGGRRQGAAFETEDGLRAEGAYVDDRRDGLWVSSRSGLPVRAETFKRGVLHGTVTEYLPDGGAARVQDYDGGLAWGRYQTWRDDGTRNLEGQFVAGQRAGLWSRYSAIGVMEESWDEPRVDAGSRPVEVFIDDKAEPLYAARTASWWRMRLNELRRDETEQGRGALALTLARAKLLGVPLEAK